MGRALWLWARREWRRHWIALALMTLVVLIAGGTALGALAAARRTASAFDRLREAIHLADLTVSPSDDRSLVGLPPDLVDRVAAVPGVTGVNENTFVAAAPAALQNFFSIAFTAERGVAQTFVSLDGPHVRSWADLGTDDVVVNEAMAAALHLRAGDDFAIVTQPLDQWAVTLQGGESGPPRGPTITGHVVSVGRVLEDVTDAPEAIMILSPAFVATYGDQVGTCRCSLQVNVRPGTADAVIPLLEEAVPGAKVEPAEDFEARIADTVSLQRHAWLLIALTATVAGALALTQAALRLGRAVGHDDRARSALGLARTQQRLGRLLTMAPVALVGALGASATAFWLSRFAPVGVTRRAEPEPGLRWDALVMGLGVLVVLVAVTAILAVAAIVQPARAARAGRSIPGVGPVVGLGVRMTTGPGRGALLGVVLGVAGVVGATTVDRSLDHLLATPALYGADFDAGLFVTDGSSRDEAAAALAADPDLEAVALVWGGSPDASGSLTIETAAGHTTVDPLAIDPVKGDIAVTLTQGRRPSRPGELALGSAAMADLGVTVGDDLVVTGADGPTRLVIVSDNLDPGVDRAGQGFAMTLDGLQQVFPASPRGVVVRFAPGADHEAVLERYASMYLQPIAPPSEVGHVGQLGGLPTALAWLLLLLGLAAVANALVASVRQFRHDIAVHRALGLSGAQVARAHLWEGLIITVAGVGVGVPVGFIAGRAIVHALVEGVGAIPRAIWPAHWWLLPPTAVVVVLAGAAVAAVSSVRRSPGKTLRAE